MSEDWKSERAEMSIKEGTEKIRKAALEKAQQKENENWENLKTSLYLGNEDKKAEINYVIDLIRQKYNLPELK